MNDNHELTIVQPNQLAIKVNPMDALALMSESEFEQRLESLKTAQRRMARIQKELMQPDVDYGVIPGTGDKPTLLKPGAEKLCKFHHLVPTFGEEIILGDGITRPHLRVLTTCSLRYESEIGPIVGQGMGAANSWEKKHRWREAQRKCPTCGAAAIYRSKYPEKNTGEVGWYCFAKKGGCGATFGEKDSGIIDQQQGQVENPDPFDIENTLRKIAAKRAQTDATLRATATSGLFTQDVEDMAGEPEAARPAQQATQRSARNQQSSKPATGEPQSKQRPPAASSEPISTAATNDPDRTEFANVGELLTWGQKTYGVKLADMLQACGVENQLQITNYANAARAIRGAFGPSSGTPVEDGQGVEA